MNFGEIANARYSCRKYDKDRPVEREKLNAVLETARLAPSACNGQPYHITVCSGDKAKQVARAATSMNINTFLVDVPIILVISEKPYCKTAAIGARLKHNDYRSIDIGILASYITAEATALGLSSCIIGWLDSDKISDICGLQGDVRLLISIGYAKDAPSVKKRKSLDELVDFQA